MRTRQLLALILILLAACTSGGRTPPSGTGTPPGNAPTPATQIPPPLGETASSPGGPVPLRVWLPPQFSPDPASPAGALLKARLDQFAEAHPEIQLIIRIKAETGPGGLLDSLKSTAAAAPDALPDLILMPLPILERAAADGLLAPLPPLDADWYDFAQQMAGEDNAVYAYPFAADALVMIYRASAADPPPRDWTTALGLSSPLIFAAGSPDALFTLALYQAANGDVLDEDGHARMAVPTLTAILEFYAQAHAQGILPAWSLDLLDEGEAYQAFREGRADFVISWLSNYLPEAVPGVGAAGLPTAGGVPYTLVRGWSWVIGNPSDAQRALATELLQYLSAPEFMALWTAAAGYIPTRPSALALWPESPEAAMVSRVVLSGQRLPPASVLELSGGAVLPAIGQVIRDGIPPAEAAEQAAGQINSP